MSDDQTFMGYGGRGGDGYLWRSPARSDGAPAVPFFRASGTVVFLLASGKVPHLLIVHKDDNGRTDDGSCPLAHVPYVGSMATVLSTMAEQS